jgi:hypothetical protein
VLAAPLAITGRNLKPLVDRRVFDIFTDNEAFIRTKFALETAAGMASATEDAEAQRLRYQIYIDHLVHAEHACRCICRSSALDSSSTAAAAVLLLPGAAVPGTCSCELCMCVFGFKRVLEPLMLTAQLFVPWIRCHDNGGDSTHYLIALHFDGFCHCRTELEHLRQRLSSCKTVHDLFLLTEKAAYVAKTAAAACRKRAADKEPVSMRWTLLASHCFGCRDSVCLCWLPGDVVSW